MAEKVASALKEARKLFKEANYIHTVDACKKILKNEKNNYPALILLAAAMGRIEEYKDEALLPLQAAVKIEPNNIIGWQGLASYYEKQCKNDQDQIKLMEAYCKILELSSSTRVVEVVEKVSELCLRIKDPDTVDKTIQTLSILKDTDEHKDSITKTLAWILTNHSINMDKHKDLLKSVLYTVMQDVNVVNRQNYCRQYIKMLYDSNDVDNFIATAIKMHNDFPEDHVFLEYICKLYYKHYIWKNNIIDVDIQQVIDELLKLDSKSVSAIIAKAVWLKDSGNLFDAREMLNEILVAKPHSLYAWLILSDIYAQLSCWKSVENAAKQVLHLGRDKLTKDCLYKMKLLLLEAMSRSENKQKLENAINMCKKLLQEDTSVELQVICARASILLNGNDSYQDLRCLAMQSELKVEYSILRALYLKKQKQLEEAAIELDNSLERSEAWLILGEIYWEIGDYNRSLMAFLNGVKINRFNWECLVHLGEYYRQHGDDIERSRRCYQAALQINPNSEDAGIGLSTAYRLLKNQDANMQLLQKLTSQNRGPKWAWLQLGLQYLDQEDAVLAIKAFQHVIRADPSNKHCWESLADAYLLRGAYISALRSYQKTLELDPDSLHPMIQVSNIKLIIGRYTEAKSDFKNLLIEKPHYTPALKGLAEACLSLAKENIANHLYGRARSNFQEAFDCLTDAVYQYNELSCIWKLLGDVCYRIAFMSDKYCYLNVQSKLITSTLEKQNTTITRFDILLLCQRLYSRALSLCSGSALLWHDLASCYFARLRLDSSVDRQQLITKCLAIGKYAVQLCPSSWIHWNFLGVICMSRYVKNYALAQHCFVMAIDKEFNNPIVWTNLGTFYLHMGNVYKANEAYAQAQHSDPAYVNSWAGQSLIAENISKREATDLFRHCVQLGYHDQAAIGYGHQVLLLLLDKNMKNEALNTYMLENMHAVTVASDVLHWYIERNPYSAYARNSYGLLLERQALYRSAVDQFVIALENECNDLQRDMICMNLGRIYIRVKKYSEAIKLYKIVKKPTFNSTSSLALALFKAEEYDEAYTTYETALKWLAEDDFEKANVLCAMAAMVYTFQGIKDAKTLLFQCTQIHRPLIPGYLAAAALGILHADLNLAKLVLDELKLYKDDKEYGNHIANLSACLHLSQGNVDQAVMDLCSGVHKHPSDTRYWMRLLRILMESNPDAFCRCAQKVIALNRNVTSLETVHVVCALSFLQKQELMANNDFVQKIIFAYPHNIKAWSTFIASALVTSPSSNNIPFHWLHTLILVVKQIFHPSGKLSDWFNDIETKVAYNLDK